MSITNVLPKYEGVILAVFFGIYSVLRKKALLRATTSPPVKTEPTYTYVSGFSLT